jgi:hypothetical protein
MDDSYKNLLKNHPFLSYLTYGGNDYVGIIQNVDEYVTAMYDFSVLKTQAEKISFLELGDVWWWESNRMIPINIFLRMDWVTFKPCLKTFNSKDVDIKYGPHVSLKELAFKRSKRKAITLVRKT